MYTSYALWSYDRLRLLQPQIKILGIWKKGARYFVVCPEAAVAKADDGTPIHAWFELNKIMTCPVELVASVSSDSEQVKDRGIDEIVKLAGSPRNIRQVLADLWVQFPSSFPNFTLKEISRVGLIPEAIFQFERALTDEEQHLFDTAFNSFKLPMSCRIDSPSQTLPLLGDFRGNHSQGDIDLIPTRWLKSSGAFSKNLLAICEEDEQLWSDKRRILFAQQINKDSLIPAAWSSKDARCLIDASVFPPYNICNYLSIYQKVTIVAPLKEFSDQIYGALNVKEDELINLVCMGRVQLLFPQSIERYPRSLLDGVSAASPENIMLSRRLAALTVCDSRRRMPLLYPCFGISERYAFLHQLHQLLDEMPYNRMRNILAGLAQELGRSWLTSEQAIHYRGAMGTAGVGIAPLVSGMFKSSTEKDLTLEFHCAAMGVEWAGALGALLLPSIAKDGTYSEEYHSAILASFYSGLPVDRIPNYVNNTMSVIDEILTIDDDLNPVEFAKIFGGSDIDRFRRTIRDAIENSTDLNSLQLAVKDFNKNVLAYDANSNRIKKWDIRGLLVASAPAIVPSPFDNFVPLADWVYQRLVGYFDNKRSENPLIGSVLDACSGICSLKPADIVLVSRMRKKMVAIKR